MKLLNFFILFSITLLFLSCSAPIGNSLLVNASSSCQNSTNLDCLNPPNKPTEGAIAINPDRPEMTVNMDGSDVVEITGSCVDLDRKPNRIFVEVFAGEQDESADPYITNEITSNCYDRSGLSGIVTSAGILSGGKCFWITKGVGLIEGSPIAREFPQCHNGQFGFSVKLGKILTNSALGLNYLVRMKIRTDDGGISDSPWTRVKISRGLSPPKITTITPNDTSYTCDIKTEVSRFNSSLLYTVSKTFNYFSGGSSSSSNLGTFTNLNSSSALAFSVSDAVVQGVTYSYNLSVIDSQYAPYPMPQPTSISSPVTCKVSAPVVVPSGVTPAAGQCRLSLLGFNPSGVSYQIKYFTSPLWTKDPTKPSAVAVCSAGSLSSECVINGLGSGTKYYIAVRSYVDNNPANGSPDTGSEQVGEWSNELFCTPP